METGSLVNFLKQNIGTFLRKARSKTSLADSSDGSRKDKCKEKEKSTDQQRIPAGNNKVTIRRSKSFSIFENLSSDSEEEPAPIAPTFYSWRTNGFDVNDKAHTKGFDVNDANGVNDKNPFNSDAFGGDIFGAASVETLCDKRWNDDTFVGTCGFSRQLDLGASGHHDAASVAKGLDRAIGNKAVEERYFGNDCFQSDVFGGRGFSKPSNDATKYNGGGIDGEGSVGGANATYAGGEGGGGRRGNLEGDVGSSTEPGWYPFPPFLDFEEEEMQFTKEWVTKSKGEAKWNEKTGDNESVSMSAEEMKDQEFGCRVMVEEEGSVSGAEEASTRIRAEITSDQFSNDLVAEEEVDIEETMQKMTALETTVSVPVVEEIELETGVESTVEISMSEGRQRAEKEAGDEMIVEKMAVAGVMTAEKMTAEIITDDMTVVNDAEETKVVKLKLTDTEVSEDIGVDVVSHADETTNYEAMAEQDVSFIEKIIEDVNADDSFKQKVAPKVSTDETLNEEEIEKEVADVSFERKMEDDIFTGEVSVELVTDENFHGEIPWLSFFTGEEFHEDASENASEKLTLLGRLGEMVKAETFTAEMTSHIINPIVATDDSSRFFEISTVEEGEEEEQIGHFEEERTRSFKPSKPFHSFKSSRPSDSLLIHSLAEDEGLEGNSSAVQTLGPPQHQISYSERDFSSLGYDPESACIAWLNEQKPACVSRPKYRTLTIHCKNRQVNVWGLAKKVDDPEAELKTYFKHHGRKTHLCVFYEMRKTDATYLPIKKCPKISAVLSTSTLDVASTSNDASILSSTKPHPVFGLSSFGKFPDFNYGHTVESARDSDNSESGYDSMPSSIDAESSSTTSSTHASTDAPIDSSTESSSAPSFSVLSPTVLSLSSFCSRSGLAGQRHFSEPDGSSYDSTSSSEESYPASSYLKKTKTFSRIPVYSTDHLTTLSKNSAGSSKNKAASSLNRAASSRLLKSSSSKNLSNRYLSEIIACNKLSRSIAKHSPSTEPSKLNEPTYPSIQAAKSPSTTHSKPTAKPTSKTLSHSLPPTKPEVDSASLDHPPRNRRSSTTFDGHPPPTQPTHSSKMVVARTEYVSLAVEDEDEFVEHLLKGRLMPVVLEPSLAPSTTNPYRSSSSSSSDFVESFSSSTSTLDGENADLKTMKLVSALAEWDMPREEVKSESSDAKICGDIPLIEIRPTNIIFHAKKRK